MVWGPPREGRVGRFTANAKAWHDAWAPCRMAAASQQSKSVVTRALAATFASSFGRTTASLPGSDSSLRGQSAPTPDETSLPCSYVLSSCVEPPHGRKVTALVAHPAQQQFATVSSDGTIKLWQGRISPLSAAPHPADLLSPGTKSAMETNTTPTYRWGCDAVLTYKGLKLSSADYSPDGSLLAVGTETAAVAMFSVQQPQLVRVLLHPGGQVSEAWWCCSDGCR